MGVGDIFSFLPNWLLYVILFGAALYLYGIWPFITNKIQLPGPKPVPFVGNLGDLASKGALATDTEYVKKYGRTFLTWMGRRPFIHISDPEMVKQVCVKDFPNFVNRPIGVPLSKHQKLFVSIIDDDHWKFVRSVLSPAFSSGKMKGMVPLIKNCINRLNDALAEKSKKGESFNIQPVMEALSLEVIGATAFSLDVDAQSNRDKMFLTKARKIFAQNVFALPPLFVSQLFPFMIPFFEAVGWVIELKDCSKYFIEVLSKSIQDKKTNPSSRKDLLQLMVDNNLDNVRDTLEDNDVDTEELKIDSLNRSKKLTDDEVMAQAIIFLLAGYKTTSSAMSFLSYNLAVYPECQEKLIQEIDEKLKGEPPTYNNVMSLPYLDMCLAETQRLYPAITGTNRVAKSSTVINGQYIPAGTALKLMLYTMQRDPQYWPDPEKFDPERFSPEQKAQRNPYVYFPFGLGPRNCVGMRLAQLEAKMAFASLLQKFRLVRSTDTQVPLKYKSTDHIESENGIWIKVVPRDQ